jgi:hypothetical protein
MDKLENNEEDLELDTSWIEEHERLEKINQNYFREPIDSINVYFIYINVNSYIEKITNEKQNVEWDAERNSSILRKEILLQWVQDKKAERYKLSDTYIYNVDLEPENIQNYSNNENLIESSHGFYKHLPLIDDILFKPSIFIFHSINAVFMIFQEIPVEKFQPKSILKNSSGERHKITKKVRIDEEKRRTTKKRVYI